MSEDDPRFVLDALIHERGEDYASLSKLIGRNAAYIQQYIKRGVPRRLAEDDRGILARYFGVPQHRLGGPREEAPRVAAAETSAAFRDVDVVMVPRLDVHASAGPGAVGASEARRGRIGFQSAFLRELSGGSPAVLSTIQVSGDSMTPTLSEGDEILVDRGDAAERLRDGIYVLRVDDALMVKRLAMSPIDRRIIIRSDNPNYPDWTDCDPASIEVIGRVIWAGRRIM